MRLARVDATLAQEDRARLAHFRPWLAEAGIAAVYASTPGEPGTTALVDELFAGGWEVRLPVLTREPDWARFTGWPDTRPGWRGIPEPTGPRLGCGSLAEAGLVVVSCLLVDVAGFRLGVGGGWYDRALTHRSPGSLVVAWARDAEVVAEVPREPFDLPCDGWVTESGCHGPAFTSR